MRDPRPDASRFKCRHVLSSDSAGDEFGKKCAAWCADRCISLLSKGTITCRFNRGAEKNKVPDAYKACMKSNPLWLAHCIRQLTPSGFRGSRPLRYGRPVHDPGHRAHCKADIEVHIDGSSRDASQLLHCHGDRRQFPFLHGAHLRQCSTHCSTSFQSHSFRLMDSHILLQRH